MKATKILRTAAVAVMCLSLLFSVASCSKKAQKSAQEPTSVTVGITQEPGLFDPHLAVAAGDKEILFNIFRATESFSLHLQQIALYPTIARNLLSISEKMSNSMTVLL